MQNQSMENKNGTAKPAGTDKIFFAVIGILTILLLVSLIINIRTLILQNSKKSDDVDSTLLVELIEPASDLVTTKYHYTEVVSKEFPLSVKDDWIIDWIRDEQLWVFPGTIYAGIDISEVHFRVDNEDKIILVTLPEPYIIAHEIIEDEVKCYDLKKSVIVDVSDNEKQEFRVEVKKSAEEKILKDEDFMGTVKGNAQGAIKALLSNAEETRGYTIKFRD